MEEKRHIGQLFNRIAGTYDTLNHVFSLNIDKLWRRLLVKRMKTVDHVLDVAIGTADLSIEICRQAKAQRVTGIDLSSEMMRIGQQKAKELPIQFMEASAEEMPFANNTFDSVTCSFGCRNFAHLDKGLNEMYRVLKVDGEVWILEFSYPENRFISWVYDLYFSHIMPLVGGWLSKDRQAYLYLNKSVKHFIWGNEFCCHLTAAGFKDVTSNPLTCGIATLYSGRKA